MQQTHPASLIDIVRRHAKTRATATVFCFEGRRLTYSAFEWRSNQAARGLETLGVGAGHRIVYVGKNTECFFIAWLAAMKLGAVMVPINWRLAPPEIARIVQDTGAGVGLVSQEFVELVRGLEAVLPGVRWLAENGGQWPDIDAWSLAIPGTAPDHVAAFADVALQLYTSGTTGRPKGAMLTHGNVMRHLGNLSAAGDAWNQWGSDDVALLAMPVAHIAGSGWGLWVMYHGACAVIDRQFDIDIAFDHIERDRVTKIFLVPAALQMMVRHPRARSVDYSRIVNVSYGASPIAPALLRECMEVFGCGFTQMYGMTETMGTIVALPPEDHYPESTPRMAAAGKPLAGVELAIIDAQGRRLASGEVGEVITRSVANMAGYWNMPEATAKTIDADGWLHTGDAGWLDTDGYLYIHDRIKDMIVSGAENIYPTEVENAVSEHPAVAEVAVIGIPDDRFGEAVMAFVVLRPDRTLGEVELLTWLRGRIAGFKLPKSIAFVEALPRNASGKLLKRELREPYWADRGRQVA